MRSKFWLNNIDIDVKLVRGFVLTYIVYGLIYFLQIDVFLVPLPMAYVFLPLVGLVMFIRSLKSMFSVLFLLIPSIVLKDFLVGVHPKMAEILVLVTVASWFLWSLHLLKSLSKKNKWVAATQFVVLLLLFDLNIYLIISIILVLLFGASAYLRKFGELSENVYNSRVFLLIQLLCSLFLLQMLSESLA